MRVKTPAKREAIIDAAIAVFREGGYERASMAAIAARVGGSKATLYGYFPSKEELFATAMMAVMKDQAQEAIDLLDASKRDVRGTLRRFGRAYLALLSSPDAIAIIRAAIGEGANSELGRMLYQCGAERAWEAMAAYVGALHEKGLVQAPDSNLAAAHLKGLLESGTIEPLLFGSKVWFPARQAVDAAIDVFLEAYGLARSEVSVPE